VLHQDADRQLHLDRVLGRRHRAFAPIGNRHHDAGNITMLRAAGSGDGIRGQQADLAGLIVRWGCARDAGRVPAQGLHGQQVVDPAHPGRRPGGALYRAALGP